MLLPSEDRTHATSVGAGANRKDNPRSQHHYRPLSTSRHFSPCEGKITRRGLSAGGRRIRTIGPRKKPNRRSAPPPADRLFQSDLSGHTESRPRILAPATIT